MEDKTIALQAIIADIKQHQCSLRNGCTQAVPGDGNPNSPVVFIGEAPGRVEDEEGRPFVGSAGKLLTSLLASVGWQRSEIYITNVVKCRPPANRDPLPIEVEEHKQFLHRELELIQPKLIVLLGRHALHWFLPEEQISKCHGQAKRQGQHVYFPVYHPAAALHNPNLGNTLKEDFLKIPSVLHKMDELDGNGIINPPTVSPQSSTKKQLSIFKQN